MAQSEISERDTILFYATHLNIPIDPDDPPPPASTSFLETRQQTKTAWELFESAEKRLVQLDQEVLDEVLNYISAQKHRTTQPQINAANARATIRLYGPRIAEAETRCQELDRSVQALEEAAKREPTTVEAQATLKIDIDVMRASLATTQDIIVVAQAQLDRAMSR